ncbi:MAG: ATP-binding cassette domain-containing protein [Lachnospiraceae bacterium]|nr:ATP-binding cassette domain-containing protein [Lachnospiraceae bacterium]
MIKVQNLSLKIKNTEILKEINLEFIEGNIYGLIGRNGSGKTMLMKCICGFVNPTDGSIEADGKTIGKDIDYLEDAGVIIENPGFIPYYSGIKNLCLLAGIRNRVNKEEICQAMEYVGLDSKSKTPVRKYSLGMRQRLGIAQAIMENPRILVLDEPMNGLDKEGVEDVRKLLLEQKKQGKLIIIASHNTEDIEILCDDVFEMEKGAIVSHFTP